MKRMLTTGTVMVWLTRVAEAHPGHGAGGGSYAVWHYLTEPMHVAAGAALIVIAAGIGFWLRRSRHVEQSDRLAR